MPSSVSILIITALNSLSCKLFICFIRLFFPHVFYLFFHLNHIPLSLIFVSTKLCQTVTYPGHEDMSLCEMSLCSMQVPSGFCRRAGSDVSRRHVLHCSVLVANILVEDETRVRGPRARTRCKPGFSYAKWLASAFGDRIGAQMSRAGALRKLHFSQV